MGLAAATMIVTVSVIGAIQLQEASAAKPGWCYRTTTGGANCEPTRDECEDERQTNEFLVSNGTRCYPNTIGRNR